MKAMGIDIGTTTISGVVLDVERSIRDSQKSKGACG